MEKSLFSTPELARLLGVFHTTIRRWIEQGKIRGIRVGRNYKIPADEVARVLNDHNLPLPESLRKYELGLTNDGEGLTAVRHRASVLEKLLIVEEIEDPALICRKETILCANQAFSNLVGSCQADLIGQDVADVIDGTVHERLLDLAQERREDPDQSPRRYQAHLKRGKMAKKKIEISTSSLKHLPDTVLLIVRGV
ncbi:MAG TPA: DNA-binding protein [Desulfobacterales bacterium]|nr:DNA-binding protein [Desulfobacterales bacterium]